MPRLLVKLNQVPEDEARELRELLEQAQIDFYETDAGRWGISVAGLWLRDETQWEQAHELVEQYDRQRAESAQRDYAEREAAGEAETLLGRLLRHPLQSLFFLALIALVLYFTLMPFFDWR